MTVSDVPRRACCGVETELPSVAGTPTRTTNVSLAAVAAILDARAVMSTPGWTICTIPVSLTKLGAVAVIVASPRPPPSIPWIQYENEMSPAFIGMSMNADPSAVAVAARRMIAGLLLVSRTVTPPCSDPPSWPLNVPYCSPAPTVVGSEKSVIGGALTVTCCVAEPV